MERPRGKESDVTGTHLSKRNFLDEVFAAVARPHLANPGASRTLTAFSGLPQKYMYNVARRRRLHLHAIRCLGTKTIGKLLWSPTSPVRIFRHEGFTGGKVATALGVDIPRLCLRRRYFQGTGTDNALLRPQGTEMSHQIVYHRSHRVGKLAELTAGATAKSTLDGRRELVSGRH